jgi:lipopolysaccharide export LptBFGC system permease protein LptF
MMNKRAKPDLPGIANLTAILAGVLLFLIFGESILGAKPNIIWIAWLTGFLFALAVLWIWLRWRNR